MANIVTNKLVPNVTLDSATKIVRIMYLLKEHGMSYFIPQPEVLLDTVLHEGNPYEPDWFTWSKAHWGTKWDMYEECRHIEHGILYYNTANSSNAVFVRWLNKQYNMNFMLFSLEEMEEEWLQEVTL